MLTSKTTTTTTLEVRKATQLTTTLKCLLFFFALFLRTETAAMFAKLQRDKIFKY